MLLKMEEIKLQLRLDDDFSDEDELLELLTDFGDQKTVFEGQTVPLGAPLDLLKDLVVEPDDASHVTLQMGFLHAFSSDVLATR